MLGGATQAMSVYIVEDPERSSGRAPWAAAPRPVGPGNVYARDWRTPQSMLVALIFAAGLGAGSKM